MITKLICIYTDDKNLYEVFDSATDEYFGFIINRTNGESPFPPAWYFYPEKGDNVVGETGSICFMKFFKTGNMEVSYRSWDEIMSEEDDLDLEDFETDEVKFISFKREFK